MQDNELFKGKIIILGNSTVGKTTLSMAKLKRDTKNVKTTAVAAAFFNYKCHVEDKEIEMEVWDTAGQEQYQSLVKNYYRGADCALILFDMSNRESFKSIGSWYQTVITERGNETSIILVANKIDKTEEFQVTREEGTSKAREIGACFVETSALSNINVDKLFELAAEIALEKKITIPCNTTIKSSKRKLSKRKKHGFILSPTCKPIEQKRKGCILI